MSEELIIKLEEVSEFLKTRRSDDKIIDECINRIHKLDNELKNFIIETIQELKNQCVN